MKTVIRFARNDISLIIDDHNDNIGGGVRVMAFGKRGRGRKILIVIGIISGILITLIKMENS